MATSPVLKAMLQSTMKEGANKRVQIKDSSSAGVSLFLDMLYTTATRTDPDYKTMLVALDLAHRWQVQNVMPILESGLFAMLTVDSFVSIAEAAALKGMEKLQRTCAAFGAKNTQIQDMLKKGSLPAVVCQLLGQRAEMSPEQHMVILLDLGQNIVLNFIVAPPVFTCWL
ncbi:unnamed protein product [Symbiodinium natans]|uniref:BTB domain-containing protein n=1 Tax=Symbiodinium natans TaxID=878477 RepID=A0A812N3P0_9DINO|nr:unnamed protein product [Symbiodinium natans]